MSAVQAADRFTALPDDLDAARAAVLARIRDGSSVMTNTSVTLQTTASPDVASIDGTVDQVRFAFRHFPLITCHLHTLAASRAAEAAGMRIALASRQVHGTPTLFIDGVAHRGRYDTDSLLEALEEPADADVDDADSDPPASRRRSCSTSASARGVEWLCLR